VGLVWAAASPSDRVTVDAFERVAGGIVDRLQAALPVDIRDRTGGLVYG
jgi:microcystin degradation protein MlrC